MRENRGEVFRTATGADSLSQENQNGCGSLFKGDKMKTKNKAASFTPGPWNIQRKGVVAFIEGRTLGVHPVAQWVYNDADARLIAAAPELLAALKSVELLLQNVSMKNKATGEARPAVEGNTYKAVVAAIAKAEGEAS